jgi:hypothetical protein
MLHRKFSLLQHHRAGLLTVPDHLPSPLLTLLARTSRSLLRRQLQTAWILARPATSISSSQAIRHCSIKSTMGNSSCPLLERNSPSFLVLAFPCFSIV